jgi:hypothetical protein
LLRIASMHSFQLACNRASLRGGLGLWKVQITNTTDGLGRCLRFVGCVLLPRLWWWFYTNYGFSSCPDNHVRGPRTTVSTPPGHRCPVPLDSSVRTPRTICPGVADDQLIAVAGARAVVEPLLDDEISLGTQEADHPSHAALVDAALLRNFAVRRDAVTVVVRFIRQRHQHQFRRGRQRHRPRPCHDCETHAGDLSGCDPGSDA